MSGELESSHEYFCVFQQLPTAAIAAPLRTRTKTSVAPLNFSNLCRVFAEQFLALLNVLQLLLVEHILIAGMDAWTCHVLSFRVRRRSAHVPWWHPSVRVRLFLVPRKRVKTCQRPYTGHENVSKRVKLPPENILSSECFLGGFWICCGSLLLQLTDILSDVGALCF